MTLTIKIKMDNAAFRPYPTAEAVRILERFIANVLSDWPGHSAFKIGLRDIKGKNAGEAKVTYDSTCEAARATN